MKTAYELAMERLSKTSPAIKLSADQKQRLAELDSKYAAKIAEREIALSGDIEKSEAAGDMEKADELRRQLAQDRKALHTELEERKDRVRKE